MARTSLAVTLLFVASLGACASREPNRDIAAQGSDAVSTPFFGPVDPNPGPPLSRIFTSSEQGCRTLHLFFSRVSLRQFVTGLPGHSAIGVDNNFYDYGPEIANSGLRALLGVQAAPFYDRTLSPFGDMTTAQAYRLLPVEAQKHNERSFALIVSVTNEQAESVLAYWRELYAKVDDVARRESRKGPRAVYRAFGDQCTTVVVESLVRAGIVDSVGPIERFIPTLLARGFEKRLVSTCGGMKGIPAVKFPLGAF